VENWEEKQKNPVWTFILSLVGLELKKQAKSLVRSVHNQSKTWEDLFQDACLAIWGTVMNKDFWTTIGRNAMLNSLKHEQMCTKTLSEYKNIRKMRSGKTYSR
jgi:DNA-directed RNA polymerase specialized sigma24 family protein